MTNTSATWATILMVTAAFISGTMSGYWFRGHVLIAQQDAAWHAFVTAPPHFVLAPPTGVVPGYPGTGPVPAPK